MAIELIFLAAGRGLRMGSLTESLPKPLIPVVDGYSILEIDLRNLLASALDAQVTVVGGHCWAAIERFCATRPAGLAPRAVFNAHFADAGAVRSIETALDSLEAGAEAVAVANGDTVYAIGLFSALARQHEGLFLVASREESILADDMALVLDDAGFVTQAEKGADGRGGGFISAGLLLARGAAAVAQLREAVQELVSEEQERDEHLTWHGVLRHLHDRGAPVHLIEIDRTQWREFDSQECLHLYAKHLHVAQ